MTLTIAPESPLDGDGAELVRQAQEFSTALYPPASRHGLDATALAGAAFGFLVVRLDGKAVGCGAYRLGPAEMVEIKSMFVLADVRGHGVGSHLLEAIEQAARDQGATVTRLETGVASAAALGLYRGAGYRECPPFGGYAADPLSVFLEKPLTA